ncbi:MAG TPA: O-antigen ligase family protein [Bacteroidales bacterium]|nr:O-antigen ligase family protein [Bacteroidales bacterium]HOG66582.1 O-antigen ligase family protein [Bacteroidales bacterium]
MTERIKLIWIYGLSLIFIALNIYFILKEVYWFLVIPLVLVVALLYIFSMDKILLLIAFVTPLSIYLVDPEFNLGISIPAEPLMFGVLIIVILKLIGGFGFDQKIIRHPLSLSVFAYLGWILVSTLTSEIPIVSVKFFVAKLWFVIPFFFVAAVLFKDFRNIKKFIWLYVISLLIVVVYTTIRHMHYGFTEKAGNWVMRPFYNDHTAYGAILALFIPLVVGFVFTKRHSFSVRMTSFVALLFLLLGLFLSFSRAAWISVAVGILVYIIILLKIKFKYIFGFFFILLTLFFSFQHKIVEVLERNRQDSSTDFIEHVQSIYNISSDASNLERINRWQAGIRMFQDRPWMGWGPGTYQFLYAPFQRSKEKTIISTNLGDMGNAHSEYIGPLAEQGLPGLLTISFVVIIGVYTALKVRKRSNNPEVRMISLVVIISLVTYFTHGFLNNFLDTDKASVPVWGLFAIILALDIYHCKEVASAEVIPSVSPPSLAPDSEESSTDPEAV